MPEGQMWHWDEDGEGSDGVCPSLAAMGSQE